LEEEYPALRSSLMGVRKVLTGRSQTAKDKMRLDGTLMTTPKKQIIYDYQTRVSRSSLELTPRNRNKPQLESGKEKGCTHEEEPARAASRVGSVEDQEPGTSYSMRMKTRNSEKVGEPEKEKKNTIIKGEEISRISSQIKTLEEERKRLQDDKTAQTGKPRIISNVQIAPPRQVEQDEAAQRGQQEEEWTEVRGRREGVRRRETNRTASGGRERSRSGTRLRKPPRAAVVSIRARNEGVSYAEVLKKARQEVSLGDLGIETTRIKKGINGSLLIEIPGQEGNEKAKKLLDKLREARRNGCGNNQTHGTG